ncbi:MAG: hypothetical protein ACLFVX_07695 [Archaeoglobaceae archaeon]
MGTLTIVLDDDVEKELRRAVSELYGSSKGSLSRIIEDALRNYLHSAKEEKKCYRAYKDNELVAESESIDELAAIIKEKDLDPRGLRITSSEEVKKVARTGYRLRKTGL